MDCLKKYPINENGLTYLEDLPRNGSRYARVRRDYVVITDEPTNGTSFPIPSGVTCGEMIYNKSGNHKFFWK